VKVWALALWLLALEACTQSIAKLPTSKPANPQITLAADPLPLNPAHPDQSGVGNFTYSGGLVLSSKTTSQLHGLSDLRVQPDGTLFAESDEGGFLSAHLVLDQGGRLKGLGDGKLTLLTGPDGKPLPSKQEADAEGLAILENGDRLISFEHHHRILLYPARGGPPHEVPSPKVDFPENGGMEGLAQDPARGADAYVVGGEVSGQTWACSLHKGCEMGPTIPKPADFGLVALAPLPGDRLAYLLRAWDPLSGCRIALVIHDRQGRVLDRLDLKYPFTVDNFEGLAAVPGIHGTIRFYLISDDNFSPAERTLLLAFDWMPMTEKPTPAPNG